MTNRIRRYAALSLMLLFAFAAMAQQPKSPGLKLPAYKKVQLKNGMTVLLMEQHKVPLISLNYIVRAGSVADPAGKEGLASVTASMLRRGTKTRTAEQIAEQIDSMGASLSLSASLDYSSGRAEFMKDKFPAGLEIVADVLQNPSFTEVEVKKMISQRVDGIKSAKDRAQAVIPSYYNAFLFGTHPYGRPTSGDESSLAGITRDDVVKFYSANYVPANVIVAVVGDFNTAEMEKLVSERFAGWTSTVKPAAMTLPPTKAVTGNRLLLVDKPDSTQTFFMIGNVGVARTNPDRVQIEVVNTLFGGRFTSMINSALRIKSGLTYGARSEFEMNKVPGPFAIFSYTRNETTEKALDMTLDVVRQLHEKGFTAEELASAKAYIKGTLPPEMLETSDQLASLLTELQFYGLSDSEVNDYYAKVDAMTLADSKRIIETYFPEKSLTFALIGKASEIGPVVKKYAPEMKTKSITEPGF